MPRKRILPVCLALTFCLLAVSCHGDKIAPAAGGLEVACLAQAPQTAEELALPLAYWHEASTAPRHLSLFFLRIDLKDPRLEVAAMPARDPDGEGQAESVLTDPIEVFKDHRALAAVNANAFNVIKKPLPSPDPYPEGSQVDVQGLLAHEGRIISPPEPTGRQDPCFWIDNKGQPHVGKPGANDNVREGVGAWCIDLVDEGRPLPAPDEVRHPRTALGLDKEGRWLLLAVVDGRQPGYSEGMSGRELADLMIAHGCHRAINLDGGGSTVMLIDQAGKPKVVNTPSTSIMGIHRTRPVPNLIGVRLAENRK